MVTKTADGDCWGENGILTQAQVAKRLQVNPRQLDRMGVPQLDLGRKTKRYVWCDVVDWLESQRGHRSGRAGG